MRQICERAGANIAAVNYHFGDKERLYRAVMRQAYANALAKFPLDGGAPPNPSAEERLHAFVRSFLWRILSEGPHAHHGKLMAREMVEPSAALDEIVREDLTPMAAALISIVHDLLGTRATKEDVRRCAMSVVGQVVFYNHCRPAIRRLFPDSKFEEADIERIAGHITRFSLSAIKELSRGRKSAKTRHRN